MQTMLSDNRLHQTGSRRKTPASRTEILVSSLSRTSGYVALALGIVGVAVLLSMIF
ncbi:MAG: hypothetical protein AB7E05_08165 [Sphingobium sp.]